MPHYFGLESVYSEVTFSILFSHAKDIISLVDI